MKPVRTYFASISTSGVLSFKQFSTSKCKSPLHGLDQDVDVTLAVNASRDRLVRLQVALNDFEDAAPAAEFVMIRTPVLAAAIMRSGGLTGSKGINGNVAAGLLAEDSDLPRL
jgi:hypothetical protein